MNHGVRTQIFHALTVLVLNKGAKLLKASVCMDNHIRQSRKLNFFIFHQMMITVSEISITNYLPFISFCIVTTHGTVKDDVINTDSCFKVLLYVCHHVSTSSANKDYLSQLIYEGKCSFEIPDAEMYDGWNFISDI